MENVTNFGGEQPPVNTGAGQRRAGRLSPTCPSISNREWWEERTATLHRICRCIDAGMAKRKSLHKQFVRFVRTWDGRPYRTDPTRRLRLKYGSLRGVYYRWKNGGKSPEAIALRYCCPKQKLVREDVLGLARLCLAPGVTSIAAGFAGLKNPRATAAAYRYATPTEVQRNVIALLAARREAERRERYARQSIERSQGGLPAHCSSSQASPEKAFPQ
jgi:hypothetical protein